MGICKPYLYEAAKKYTLPQISAQERVAECPYARDLLPIPPKNLFEQPNLVTTGTACSNEPLINYKTSSGRALVNELSPPFVVNVSAHPPRPMTVFDSTMRDTYPPHSVNSGITVPTIKEIAECKLNRVGLDCEPPFPCEEGGYVTELDFLLPTSAKDFRRFRPDELNVDAPLTIYTERGAYKPKGLAPTLAGCRPAHGSIWDEVRMRKRVPNTYIPHRLSLVPHRGMCSEMQEKYKHRTDELHTHSLFPSVKYPVSLYPYKSEEVLLCPGMYVPESAHYGSRIPVNTFVDTTKTKEDNNIEFCTMKKKPQCKKSGL